MSAELDINTQTGVANYVEFKNAGEALVISAWHRDGKPVRRRDELSGEEQVKAAMIDIEGDYDVDVRPTFYTGIDEDGNECVKQSETSFITYRTDRGVAGQELGAVGPDYEAVPNRVVFQGIVPLLDSGLMVLETGGVLRSGADAWLLGRWATETLSLATQDIIHELRIAPYAYFSANHTGRRKITVAETFIRVVCANTQAMTEHEIDGGKTRSRSISHRKGASVRVVEASEELFADVAKRFDKLAENYRTLKSTLLTENDFADLILDQIAADPRNDPRFNPEARNAESLVDRRLKKRAALVELWDGGVGHSGDHSAWEAVQAVIEAVDHRNDLFPVKGGALRTGALMSGTLRKTKEETYSRVLRFAKGESVEQLEEMYA